MNFTSVKSTNFVILSEIPFKFLIAGSNSCVYNLLQDAAKKYFQMQRDDIMAKERIEWIDIAKGITILLVIVGHGTINGVLRGIIFSFHMPLFFILSSITFRLSENRDMFVRKTERAFVHLMLAAIGIYFFRTLLHMVQNYSALQLSDLHALKDYLAERVNIFVYGSGVATPVGDTRIPALGVPWFLIALFFGRTLFDYMHLKLKKTYSLLLFALHPLSAFVLASSNGCLFPSILRLLSSLFLLWASG